MKPTVYRLKEIIEYDPISGVFTWKFRRDVRGGWNSKCAGKRAGRIDSSGHRQIAIDGHRYQASNLAWLYMKGVWPLLLVDHRNTIKDDDRFENLREATYYQNSYNRGAQVDNKSGYKGVYQHKDNGVWVASITVEKVQKYLGCFATAEEASCAYEAAAIRFHGEFARID